MYSQKIVFQLIWGILLMLAGIGVIFRVEQVLPRIEAQFEYFTAIRWFVRLSFYLIAIVLIGGGGKKVYRQCIQLHRNSSDAR